MSVKTRAPSQPLGGRHPGVAEHRHARGERAGHAGGRVLHHRARRRLPAHRGRRVEEEVGRRLAVLDLGGAEDAAVEALQQPRVPEREADLLVRAARGHADRERDRVERIHHARHRLQLLLEGGEHRLAVLQPELLGDRGAALRRPRLDRLPRPAQERLDRLLGRQRQADAGQQPREHAVGDRLGVDQDPVAIEDDGANQRTRTVGPCSSWYRSRYTPATVTL